MKPNKYGFFVKHLSRDEFSAALRKGQGRALLHVVHYGLENVSDLVLEACLHNQVYDTDFDAGRGDWLFRMFSESLYFSEFRQAILNALQTETDIDNLSQLCWLTFELARRGDTSAHSMLKEVVFRAASGIQTGDWRREYMGVYNWLFLEGTQGALDLARVYGQRLMNNPEDPVNETLFDYDDFPGLKGFLQGYTEKEQAIKVYLQYMEKKEKKHFEESDRRKAKQDYHTKVREKYTLVSILQDAKNPEDISLGRFMIFGKHATKNELQTIYTHLLSETDPVTEARLLRVFWLAKLPQLEPVIFNWANGNNLELRKAAVNALSQVKDERVHALAQKKVETCSLTGADSYSLNLFVLNYKNGDSALLMQGLQGIKTNQDDAHQLGMSIRNLSENFSDPDLVGPLLWVYENTPCGFCRYMAVKRLAEWDKLPAEIRFECQYDAEDDAREFAWHLISQESR